MAARTWSWWRSRISIVRAARSPVLPDSDRLCVEVWVRRELARRGLMRGSAPVVSEAGGPLPGTAEGVVIRGIVGVSSAGGILRAAGTNVTHVTGPRGRSIGTGFEYRVACDRCHAYGGGDGKGGSMFGLALVPIRWAEAYECHSLRVSCVESRMSTCPQTSPSPDVAT